MKLDLLVCEIGSTTTVVNAFDKINTPNPVFIAQGISPTTVDKGDASIGVFSAIKDLEIKLNGSKVEYNEFFATSSAAGGLKMTVHGLVHDMTVNAAYEAAIGAGANIHLISSGKLRDFELEKIKEIEPNIIIVAGGVDYGERDTALYNSKQIAKLKLDIPVIYAGNIENHEEVKHYFNNYHDIKYLTIVDNVYPKIDELNVEQTRKIIQDTFEVNITKAKGMSKIDKLITGNIMPTPGAVMEATKLLNESLGDIVCFDVGGATTDIHSVCKGDEDLEKVQLSPEPFAKRTVEGDLGTYVSVNNVVDLIKKEKVNVLDNETLATLLKEHKPIPTTKEQFEFVSLVTKSCLEIGLERHAGIMKRTYLAGSSRMVCEGKDLTTVNYVIGTGGALTRNHKAEEIIKDVLSQKKLNKMYPKKDTKVLIDKDYIMASCGVISKKYKQAALSLLKNSLNIGE